MAKDRIIDAVVESVSLGKSRVKGEREVMFRSNEVGTDHVVYPRVSFSQAIITRGANIDRTMCDVSVERFAKVLDCDADLKTVAQSLSKLEKARVKVILRTRPHPETGVDTEYADSIIFAGETAPSMSADEWCE
jgi:hypothetical protein